MSVTNSAIEELITKKFNELKADLLKDLAPNVSYKELSDKLDNAIKAQNEFIKKMQNLLMLIDGTYNTVGSIKTPTKIQTRKPKQNNIIIDVSTPSDTKEPTTTSVAEAYEKTSASISSSAAQETKKVVVPKRKYRTNCINMIMDGKIKLTDIGTVCAIDITEIKQKLAEVKASSLNTSEKRDKFKDLVRDFIYSIGDARTEKLKKFMEPFLSHI
jgi:hypothetical protein